MQLITFIALSLFSLPTFAYEMDMDLSEQCRDEFEGKIEGLDCETIPDYTLIKKDDNGSEWKIRFHFGFSRTDYAKTDLHINNSLMNVVVKDVVFSERTSDSHYNPANWEGFTTAFKWIDEPTNTFALSLEKGKNNFYLTVFHPKFLKSVLYKETQVDGVSSFEFKDIYERDDFSQVIPEGYNMLYLGNTHYNMNWQVGYGRQFSIFDSKKWGKLTYVPKADIGIATGKARSVRIVPGVAWDDYIDDHKIQGYNASIGHRLEYSRGNTSLFVDHKTIINHLEHGFYDGTVEYNLRSSPLTFGIGFQVFNKKKPKIP